MFFKNLHNFFDELDVWIKSVKYKDRQCLSKKSMPKTTKLTPKVSKNSKFRNQLHQSRHKSTCQTNFVTLGRQKFLHLLVFLSFLKFFFSFFLAFLLITLLVMHNQAHFLIKTLNFFFVTIFLHLYLTSKQQSEKFVLQLIHVEN